MNMKDAIRKIDNIMIHVWLSSKKASSKNGAYNDYLKQLNSGDTNMSFEEWIGETFLQVGLGKIDAPWRNKDIMNRAEYLVQRYEESEAIPATKGPND